MERVGSSQKNVMNLFLTASEILVKLTSTPGFKELLSQWFY